MKPLICSLLFLSFFFDSSRALASFTFHGGERMIIEFKRPTPIKNLKERRLKKKAKQLFEEIDSFRVDVETENRQRREIIELTNEQKDIETWHSMQIFWFEVGALWTKVLMATIFAEPIETIDSMKNDFQKLKEKFEHLQQEELQE